MELPRLGDSLTLPAPSEWFEIAAADPKAKHAGGAKGHKKARGHAPPSKYQDLRGYLFGDVGGMGGAAGVVGKGHRGDGYLRKGSRHRGMGIQVRKGHSQPGKMTIPATQSDPPPFTLHDCGCVETLPPSSAGRGIGSAASDEHAEGSTQRGVGTCSTCGTHSGHAPGIPSSSSAPAGVDMPSSVLELTQTHTQTQTQMRSPSQAQTQSHFQFGAQAHTHTHPHTQPQTQSQSHFQFRAQAHTHTHTHSHSHSHSRAECHGPTSRVLSPGTCLEGEVENWAPFKEAQAQLGTPAVWGKKRAAPGHTTGVPGAQHPFPEQESQGPPKKQSRAGAPGRSGAPSAPFLQTTISGGTPVVPPKDASRASFLGKWSQGTRRAKGSQAGTGPVSGSSRAATGTPGAGAQEHGKVPPQARLGTGTMRFGAQGEPQAANGAPGKGSKEQQSQGGRAGTPGRVVVAGPGPKPGNAPSASPTSQNTGAGTSTSTGTGASTGNGRVGSPGVVALPPVCVTDVDTGETKTMTMTIACAPSPHGPSTTGAPTVHPRSGGARGPSPVERRPRNGHSPFQSLSSERSNRMDPVGTPGGTPEKGSKLTSSSSSSIHPGVGRGEGRRGKNPFAMPAPGQGHTWQAATSAPAGVAEGENVQPGTTGAGTRRKGRNPFEEMPVPSAGGGKEDSIWREEDSKSKEASEGWEGSRSVPEALKPFGTVDHKVVRRARNPFEEIGNEAPQDHSKDASSIGVRPRAAHGAPEETGTEAAVLTPLGNWYTGGPSEQSGTTEGIPNETPILPTGVFTDPCVGPSIEGVISQTEGTPTAEGESADDNGMRNGGTQGADRVESVAMKFGTDVKGGGSVADGTGPGSLEVSVEEEEREAVRRVEVGGDKVRGEEMQREEVQREEVQGEEVQREEVQREEVQREEVNVGLADRDLRKESMLDHRDKSEDGVLKANTDTETGAAEETEGGPRSEETATCTRARETDGIAARTGEGQAQGPLGESGLVLERQGTGGREGPGEEEVSLEGTGGREGPAEEEVSLEGGEKPKEEEEEEDSDEEEEEEEEEGEEEDEEEEEEEEKESTSPLCRQASGGGDAVASAAQGEGRTEDERSWTFGAELDSDEDRTHRRASQKGKVPKPPCVGPRARRKKRRVLIVPSILAPILEVPEEPHGPSRGTPGEDQDADGKRRVKGKEIPTCASEPATGSFLRFCDWTEEVHPGASARMASGAANAAAAAAGPTAGGAATDASSATATAAGAGAGGRGGWGWAEHSGVSAIGSGARARGVHSGVSAIGSGARARGVHSGVSAIGSGARARGVHSGVSAIGSGARARGVQTSRNAPEEGGFVARCATSPDPGQWHDEQMGSFMSLLHKTSQGPLGPLGPSGPSGPAPPVTSVTKGGDQSVLSPLYSPSVTPRLTPGAPGVSLQARGPGSDGDEWGPWQERGARQGGGGTWSMGTQDRDEGWDNNKGPKGLSVAPGTGAQDRDRDKENNKGEVPEGSRGLMRRMNLKGAAGRRGGRGGSGSGRRGRGDEEGDEDSQSDISMTIQDKMALGLGCIVPCLHP